MRKLVSTTVGFALLLAALSAGAAERPSGPGAFASVLGGAQVSLENPGFTAFALRLEGTMDLAQLAPKVDIGGVVALDLWHMAEKRSAVLPGFETITVESQASVFELVPAARLTFVPAPRFWLFADAGAGIGYTAAKASMRMGATSGSGSGSGFSGLVHFAFGGMVVPTENVRLSIELVGLSFRYGKDGENLGTTYDVLVGVSHRL